MSFTEKEDLEFSGQNVEDLAKEQLVNEQIEKRPATAEALVLASEDAINSLRERLVRNSAAQDYLVLIDNRWKRFLVDEKNGKPSEYAQSLVSSKNKGSREISDQLIAELNPLFFSLYRAIVNYNALTQAGDPAIGLLGNEDGLKKFLRAGEVGRQTTTSVFGLIEGLNFSVEEVPPRQLVVIDPFEDQDYWQDRKRVFEKTQKREINTADFVALRSIDAVFELEAFAREAELGKDDGWEEVAASAEALADFIEDRSKFLSQNFVKNVVKTDFVHGDFDENLDVLNAAEILKKRNPQLFARLLGVGQSSNSSEAKKSDLFGNVFHIAAARSERFSPKNLRGASGLAGRQILTERIRILTQMEAGQLPFHHVNFEQINLLQKKLRRDLEKAKTEDDKKALKDQLSRVIIPTVFAFRETELHNLFEAVAHEERESDPMFQLRRLEKKTRKISDPEARFGLFSDIAVLEASIGIDPDSTLAVMKKEIEKNRLHFWGKLGKVQVAIGRYCEAEQIADTVSPSKEHGTDEVITENIFAAAIKERQFALARHMMKKNRVDVFRFDRLYRLLTAEAEVGIRVDITELTDAFEKLSGVNRPALLLEVAALQSKIGGDPRPWFEKAKVENTDKFYPTEEKAANFWKIAKSEVEEELRAGKFDEAWNIVVNAYEQDKNWNAFLSLTSDVLTAKIKELPPNQIYRFVRAIFRKKEQLGIHLSNFYKIFIEVIENLVRLGQILKADEILYHSGYDIEIYELLNKAEKVGIARAMAQAGFIKEAGRELIRAGELSEFSEEIFRTLISAEARTGNFEEVERMLEKTDDNSALENLVRIALIIGRLDKASEFAQKYKNSKWATPVSSEKVYQLFRQIAFAQAAAGRLDEAKQTLRKNFAEGSSSGFKKQELLALELETIKNDPLTIAEQEETEMMAKVEREARGLFGEHFYGIREWEEVRSFGLEKPVTLSAERRRMILTALDEKMQMEEFKKFIADSKNLAAVKSGKWNLFLSRAASEDEYVWVLLPEEKFPNRAERLSRDFQREYYKIFLETHEGREVPLEFFCLRVQFNFLFKKYTERFTEFEKSPPVLELPEFPPNLTEAHLECFNEIFGDGNLEFSIMPNEDQLTTGYFQAMYPEIQRPEDTARGLRSFNSSWFKKNSDPKITGKTTETWFKTYIRSLKATARKYQDLLILTESVKKPNFIDGEIQYTTKEGGSDPLIPILQEVFGKTQTHRCSLAHDHWTTQVIPELKRRIIQGLTAKGLTIPNFEIILTPAIIFNQQTTLNHPENSQTVMPEWSDDTLLKQNKTNGGFRLTVGNGAGYISYDRREHNLSNRGGRLSVVFLKS